MARQSTTTGKSIENNHAENQHIKWSSFWGQEGYDVQINDARVTITNASGQNVFSSEPTTIKYILKKVFQS